MSQEIIIYILIVMIILILILLILLQMYTIFNGHRITSMEHSIGHNIERNNKHNNKVPYNALNASPGLIQQYAYNKLNDDIKEYDYRKAYDPFEEPVRRVPRHELPPAYLKRMIDIPTRGYPDSFVQIGTLVKEGDPNKNDANTILRLFGRQEYPGSNRYEYYTAINSGYDQIKVPIDLRRQEIYDDDFVYIKELSQSYRVHLSKYDQPRYYPDVI